MSGSDEQPRQLIDVPIGVGIDEGEDARVTQRLIECRDLVVRKKQGLTQRHGQRQRVLAATNAVGQATPPPAPDAIAVRGDEVLRVGGGQVHTYAPTYESATGGRWSLIGNAPALSVQRDSFAAISANYANVNIAVSTSVMAMVYSAVTSSGNQNIFARLFDAASLAPLGQPILIVASTTVHEAQIEWSETDQRFFVVYTRDAAVDLEVQTVNPATLTASGALLTIATAASKFACCARPGGGILIALQDSALSPQRRLIAVNVSGTITSNLGLTDATSDVTQSFSVWCDVASRVWVAYARITSGSPPSSVVRAALADATNAAALTLTLAPTTVATYAFTVTGSMFQCAIVEESSTLAKVAYSVVGQVNVAEFDRLTACRTITSAGTVSTLDSRMYGVRLSGQFFRVNGVSYAIATTSDSLAIPAVGSVPALASTFVLSFDPAAASSGFSLATVHAHYGVNVSALQGDNQPRVVRVMPDGSRACPVDAWDTAWFIPTLQLARIRASQQVVCAELGPRALIGGGLPFYYDGREVVPCGFFHAPRVTAGTKSAGALSGAYQWRATYELVDANGDVLRSIPSPVLSDSLAAQVVDINIVPLQVGITNDINVRLVYGTGTSRSQMVPVLVLYRTTANSANPFFQETAAIVASSQFCRYGEASRTQASTTTDANLAVRAPIYTDGDVLDAVCPPSALYACAHDNRFFLAGTDDDSIWYSTEYETGRVPYFNEALRFAPFAGGRVTGLASMDGKLIVFKDSRVAVIPGRGPDARGIGSTYDVPNILASDVGCIDARSIVQTAVGVFFRSRRGIELLDRGLSVQFVGDRVEALTEVLATAPAYASEGPWYRIQSAVAVEEQHQVRWSVFRGTEAGGVRTGDVVVYDYLHDAWTVMRMPGDRVPVAAAYVGGAYTWLDSAGQLYVEDDATFADLAVDGTVQPFSARMRTAWQKPTGLQGYFHVIKVGVLGEFGVAHTLTVRIYKDFDLSTPINTTTFALAAAPAGGYQFAISPGVRAKRVQSLLVEVEVSGQTVSGQACALSGINIEFVPLQGQQKRVGDAQKG